MSECSITALIFMQLALLHDIKPVMQLPVPLTRSRNVSHGAVATPPAAVDRRRCTATHSSRSVVGVRADLKDEWAFILITSMAAIECGNSWRILLSSSTSF